MSKDYEAILPSFKDTTIDPEDFSHADHIGIAYTLLRQTDFLEASLIYSRSIQAIATKAGAEKKFNVTITLAFLSLIAERMQTTEHANFETFLAANPDLQSRSLLGKWYSDDRLQSDLGRTVFLMPDAA